MSVQVELHRWQRGVSIIAAVFLLLLFAALATYMLWITSAQNRGQAQDFQGARAYQAARAGVEWGLYQLQRNSSCTSPVGGNSVTFAGTSLADFTASVTCVKTGSTDELGNAVQVYAVSSTACNVPVSGTCIGIAAGGSNYVERQIQVTTECVPSGDAVTPSCP